MKSKLLVAGAAVALASSPALAPPTPNVARPNVSAKTESWFDRTFNGGDGMSEAVKDESAHNSDEIDIFCRDDERDRSVVVAETRLLRRILKCCAPCFSSSFHAQT